MFVKAFRVLLYVFLFILISTTFILIAVQQTLFEPYETVDALQGTGIYNELHDTLPEAFQQSEELSEVTADDNLNEIFINVVREELTVNRIGEILTFIEKDIWDYILEKDSHLDEIDITDLRTTFLEEVQRSDSMQGQTIYNEKFIDQVEWAPLFKMDEELLSRLKMYYAQLTSLIIWNALIILIFIGLSFFLAVNRIKNLKWLAAIGITTGFTLVITAMLLHIIGIDWMYANIQLSGLFTELTDNIHEVMKQKFIDFLSALLGFSGLSMVSGVILYMASIWNGKKSEMTA